MNLLARSEEDHIREIVREHTDFFDYVQRERAKIIRSENNWGMGLVFGIIIMAFLLLSVSSIPGLSWTAFLGIFIIGTAIGWILLIGITLRKHFEQIIRNKTRSILENNGYNKDLVDSKRWYNPKDFDNFFRVVWENEAEFIKIYLNNLPLERNISEDEFRKMLHISVTPLQLPQQHEETLLNLFQTVRERIHPFESATFPKPKIHPALFMKHIYIKRFEEELDFHSKRDEDQSKGQKNHDYYISFTEKFIAEFKDIFARKRIGGDIAINIETTISEMPENIFFKIFSPVFSSNGEFLNFMHQWRKSYAELMAISVITDPQFDSAESAPNSVASK